MQNKRKSELLSPSLSAATGSRDSPSHGTSAAAFGVNNSIQYPDSSNPKVARKNGFLCEKEVKESVKQDTTPVSANLGWNARLSEECAKILALIKTGGYDGCNPYHQKYYTKWKDELNSYANPIYKPA